MEDRCYRATINSLPREQVRVRDSAVPLFFSVEFEKPGVPVPTVSEELVRCSRCKAYLNPYVEILMPGLRWTCNLCRTVNEETVPFQMVDRQSNDHGGDAIRNAAYNRQYFTRADLRSDIYEIEAPSSFSTKTSEAPVLCFVIDVSLEAQKLSVLPSVLSAAREVLRGADYDPRTRVCFLFYSAFVYLLNTNRTISVVSEPHPLVLRDSFLFSLDEARAMDGPLDVARLEKYFAQARDIHADILAPLDLLRTVLRGASVFLFFAALPNHGASRLEASDSLVCRVAAYRTLAETLARRNIGVNLFAMARASIGLPAVGILAQLTGGAVFHYSNYDGLDSVATAKLFCDLSDHLAANIGYGGVCRIRTSDGAVLHAVHGNFMQKSQDLLGLANWCPGHALNFSLMLFNDVPAALYIQIAMIRVTKTGRRLIRVFNICVPVSNSSFYDSCDCSAICHGLLLDAFYHEGRRKGSGAERLQRSLVTIWNEVRAKNGQIPPALANLPSLVLAARKSVPLRPDNATPIDFRAFHIHLFSNAHSKTIDLLTYPLLLNLGDACLSPLPLSCQSLVPDSLMILDTGAALFFYAGKACDPLTVAALFDSPVSGPVIFDPPENEFSRYVSDIVVYMLAGRSIKPRMFFVSDAENSVFSNVFHSYMYDDAIYGLPSLSEHTRSLASTSK